MIESSKLFTHEAYCRRNFVKCDICMEFYDKNIKDEHLEEHKMKTCNYCKQAFE